MRKATKTLLLLVCITLCLGALSSCFDFLGADEPVWTPKGEEITLIEAGTISEYVIVFTNEDELSNAAAADFKSMLTDKNLQTTGMIISDGVSDQKQEILFGFADRDVSKKAQQILDEKVKTALQDLHCVFYYYDGKLAIVANSELAYEMALIEFSERYINSGKVSFKDTLCDHITYNYNDYIERKLEVFLANSAEVKEERENGATAEILAKLEAQRNELTASGAFGSSTANIGTSSWGTAPTTPSADHPRLLINESTLPGVLKSLMISEATNERILGYFNQEIVNDCILPAPKYQGTNDTVDADEVHNFNEGYLEIIQVKALAYLLTEDPYYGYQAIYYIKNYIESLDIVQIPSDQCREYGSVMYTAAIVYDWCYDLLTDVDKEQIIAGIENRICRGKNEAGAKMEVGFPPSKQTSVSGHGSERQILRDYLSFATAIYGDNNSWWDYVAARVYNDYVPVRNYYYKSGMVHQGTGYIPGRYISDLFSAWILKVATGENPYIGMATVTKSIIGYECAPGKVFNDGDGTGNTKTTSSFLHSICITAYLEGDPVLLAQTEYIKGSSKFSSSHNYLTSVAYAALRGLTNVKPAENRYEGMELIQYNGHPLGQYVIREAWNDGESAAAMMRIKERTTANHEHKDTGTFEIYYKGALTTDGGCYNNYNHAHTKYFHQATISHNGLIIYNPNRADTLSGWYSGGQKNHTDSGNLEGLLNPACDRAVITGRQHAYSDSAKTSPLYAYIAGDITKAYDDDTVDYVGRRMLTVYTGDEDYPMVFFVYDDITSDNKSFEKRFLLQISSKNEPTVDTEDQTVITENGGGRLVLTCLSDNVSINKVGGRNDGKYYADKSSNYLIEGRQLVPKSKTADDGHWGRVEIVYNKPSNNATFLNVLYVTDAGNEKLKTVRATSLENGLTGGVYDKRIAVLFATSRERAAETVSCKTYGSGTMSYYVSGAKAGNWTVTVDGKSIGTFEATADGGLLTFEAPAGEVKISPVK